MLRIALHTLLGFSILFLLTRFMGKKQLSQLTIFTYITGIVLGEMVGMLILDENVRVIDGILAIVIWSALVFLIELLTLKSAKARVIMNGEPAIVVKHGEILERSLRRHRLSLDDLSMQLRLQQVFSITEVEYAILEPNGALTIMIKDTQARPEPQNLPGEIICDGKVVEKNLPELGFTRQQLDDELRRQGVHSVKDVFYAQVQADKSLYVQRRQRRGRGNE